MPPNPFKGVESASFLPTLLANLFPLFGILRLDWRVVELFAIYWLEIGTGFLVYGVAALFARLPVVLDGRSFYLPGVSPDTERDQKWTRDSRPIDLPGSLPPIYPRNVRLILWTLATGFAFLGIFLVEYPQVVEVLRSPSLVLTAVGMILSDWYRLYREFFREGQYEEMSAHMVLEIPGRVLFFWVVYVLLLGSVGGFTLLFLVLFVRETVGGLVPDIDLVVLFAVALVVGKVAVEWSRFRVENETEPTGFATWFLPENPRER
ncbi:DUF6498-containing protein [Halopelagius longus]|uniref:Uncharacterized protein n=1 Tax=Halopelagius longus TaxID=1236180 RepID=A0A1H1G186_9EURY|nr:DUF6498-containing protein [Halopelagius longus]RDI69920.1 hypothetical protein DWB78_17395 [Halopelagius longus]SDR06616.1 hypothetical protein SAMN05216278_3435 [Halopelagius longus]